MSIPPRCVCPQTRRGDRRRVGPPATGGPGPSAPGTGRSYGYRVADILVLNAGSSTLKYRLLPGGDGGIVERIGEPGGTADHAAAVAHILERLPDKEIRAVGHRVVHGGSRFRAPVLVDDAGLATIRELSVLAPLHNPPAVARVEAARRAPPAGPPGPGLDTPLPPPPPPGGKERWEGREEVPGG